MRNLHFAIIDEVDSVLIDEARTPLIISGQSGKSTALYEMCAFFFKQIKKILKGDGCQSFALPLYLHPLLGAVTIATNMAGRGTDIKLDEEARAAGGLKIIGTERHAFNTLCAMPRLFNSLLSSSLASMVIVPTSTGCPRHLWYGCGGGAYPQDHCPY